MSDSMDNMSAYQRAAMQLHRQRTNNMSDTMASWRLLDGLNTYQRAAARTMPKLPKRDALQMLALGLAGETGETVDAIKKFLYHGHELDESQIVQELGDILWYVANLASLYHVDLSQVASFNVAKLQERYPDGFTEERSRARVDLREENGQIGGVRTVTESEELTEEYWEKLKNLKLKAHGNVSGVRFYDNGSRQSSEDEHNIEYGTDTL